MNRRSFFASLFAGFFASRFQKQQRGYIYSSKLIRREWNRWHSITEVAAAREGAMKIGFLAGSSK